MTKTPADRRALFETAFRRHYDLIRSYAYRRGSDDPDIVASEVFTVLWRRWDEAPSEPLAWLIGVARRVVANQRRASARRDALVDRVSSHLSGNPLGRVAWERSDIAIALASLSERDREVLLLLEWEGLDGAEVAASLGITRSAVAVRAHRARRRLATALDHTRADRCPQPTITPNLSAGGSPHAD